MARSTNARTRVDINRELEPHFYADIAGLQAHFPAGAPSLLRARHLRVQGEHVFGANVIVEGRVELVNDSDTAVTVADGTRLSG